MQAGQLGQHPQAPPQPGLMAGPETASAQAAVEKPLNEVYSVLWTGSSSTLQQMKGF